MNSKIKELLNTTIIYALGNIIVKIFQYLILILLTYKLTTAEYGNADLIIQATSVLFPIVSLGMSEAILRFSFDKKYDKVKLIREVLIINTIGVIIFLTFSILGVNVFKFFQWYWHVILLTVLNVFYWSFREYTRGLEKYKEYAFGSVFGVFIQAIICYVCVFIFDLGLTGYIFSIAVSILLELIFYIIITYSHNIFKLVDLSDNYFKEIIYYSLPLIPNSIMWWLTSSSDRFIIAFFLGDSSNGLYAIANKFPSILTLVSSFFIQSWQTSSIKAIDDIDSEEFFNIVFEFFLIVLIFITTLIMLFLREIVFFLLPSNYHESYTYVPILLLATILNILQSFLSSIMMASRETKKVFFTSFITAVLNIVLSIAFIKYYGLYGACVATMVSYLALFTLRIISLKNILFLSNYTKYIVLFIFLLIQMVFVVQNSNHLNNFFITGIIVLLLLHFLLKIRNKIYENKST